MFYAMEFIKLDYTNNVTVRAVRSKPFKSLEAAVRATLKKVGQHGEGFVKKAGEKTPVWRKLK